MQINWQIKQATVHDAQGLKNCMQSAYSSYQQRMGGIRLPPMDVDYVSEIENYPTWVVKSEGGIHGGLVMVFEINKAKIANIAVDPECQGQGMGGALMRWAETKAKEKNHSEIHLVTHALLNENVSLYQHLGWEITKVDETRVFMKKVI